MYMQNIIVGNQEEGASKELTRRQTKALNGRFTAPGFTK
jgi:hypothetical protein